MFRIAGIVLFSLLAGCSDSGDRSPSAPDPMPPPPEPPPANITSVEAALSPAQVISGGDMGASGSAELGLNRDDGSLEGTVTLSGLSATGVTLNTGAAGASGDVLIALDEADTGNWVIPEGSALDSDEQERFDGGELYLLANSNSHPEGALRGQVLPDNITLIRTRLSGSQEVPEVDSEASGTAWLTLDSRDQGFVAHLHTRGLEDATMAHLHRGLAGTNGGIVFDLMQDSGDPAHWFATDMTLEAEDEQTLAAGAFYYNVHTPAFPAGELRGQVIPEGVVVDFTRLTGSDVVAPGSNGVDTDAGAVAAATTHPDDRITTIHLNTVNLPDATGATLNRAPEGQNGPVIASLEQDASEPRHWFIEELELTGEQFTALGMQSLYFTVNTPEFPDGIIRGQWRPEGSSAGGGESFRVTGVEPARGAELAEFPDTVTATFNRAIRPSSAGEEQVRLQASGGDGSFGDGNERDVVPLMISTSDNVLTIDTRSASDMTTADDTYRLILTGEGEAPITDTFGNALDGNGDGSAGGNFSSAFTVMAEMPETVTFTTIQEQIFTPNCTSSGCHSGSSPAAGQNLTAGQAYSNIVGVPSSEVPSLLRVDPGDAENSYLVQKVEGRAQVGDRMPLGAPPLPNELIQDLREWIDAGALDN